MTAEIPTIKVYMDNTPTISRDGSAGKVAVIGAFDSATTAPKTFDTIRECQRALGSDDSFNGCKVVPYLFQGASSLLCVNINVRTTVEDVTTDDKTITTAKLTAALAKIKGEDFDILFIADTMTDSFLPIVTAFLDECFEMKMPAGYVCCLGGGTTAANVTSAGLAGEHCYGMLTQEFNINDGSATGTLVAAAYYCGLIAGMDVGATMTMKQVPGVTGINPELSFETGGDGKTLLEAGITTLKCSNRKAKNYIVVNSEQPNGLDLYINRVRNYVVKELALHDFLGERNNETTIDEIKHEVDRVKHECITTLDLLKDIEFTVEKVSANKAEIHIQRLLFDGLITEIDVYVSVEVE